MSHKKRRDSPIWQWEQALIEAYYDYRWHQVLDPLYDKFQRWMSGELSHDDMGEAIHQIHKQTRELYSLFIEKRTWLVRLAQFDAEWFDAWVKAHPPPVGAHRVSRPEIVSSSDEEEQAE